MAWFAKPKRRTVPRVASDVMTSCRARRMSEGRLEREDIHSSLYRVRRMAVPQLVWTEAICFRHNVARNSEALPEQERITTTLFAAPKLRKAKALFQ